MSSIVATAGKRANAESAEGYTGNTQSGYLNDALAQVFRKLAPVKTWAALASVLGLTERAAKHRLAGTRDFTADELARLLRTEDGLAFLSAIMAGAEPKWWLIVRGQLRVSSFRQRQARVRQELQEALDEVNRNEAALLLSDADFHGPHVAAVRAATGPVGSAVAARNKRGR